MPRRSPMRVVLYARVSRASDPRSKSVDDQLKELKAWAEREGWIVIGIFRDDSISASRYANGRRRAAWEQVVELIRSGELAGGALLVWEFSRATRDKKVSAALEQSCSDAGVKIGYKGRLEDPSTADGGFNVGLDALLAARESDIVSERVKRAVDSRAADGRPHGTLSFGYRRVIDTTTGRTQRWEVDPVTGPLVKEAVERILGGEPVAAVARDFTARGITAPRGGPWQPASLARMIRRPAYAGLRVHGGEVLQGVSASWPALVTQEQHLELMALFATSDRDKFRNPNVARYIGSGIYRCGREGCDGRMRVLKDKHRAARYDCKTCHGISRTQELVDELVEETMIGWLSRGDFLERIAAQQQAPEETRVAAEEVTRLREKLTALRAAWDADRITLDAYSDMERRTLARIAEAEKIGQRMSLPPQLLAAAGDDARAKWSALPVTVKRDSIAAAMDVTLLPRPGVNGKVWDPRSVRIEWR